ncbi:type II toxin-antitoxin system Phd/YefM family antitoxin [Ruania zhangjianzhongii]|uniref:type II toxin-antitoxin system Phd/YefM family antitoxin n=1 Tax=Ruania zhangjianzhongii TaxID=2603206 RepID=UPI00143D2E13|nr:type II toxin-antitoxin system Phd/YefM family antitoxin [Ruania zhangjianzhongii]
MSTVNASQARQTLPAQLDRVAKGESVEITRHGRVVAVLVSPELLRSRRALEAWKDADLINERLEHARREPIPPPSLTAERAEELVTSVRADRNAR